MGTIMDYTDDGLTSEQGLGIFLAILASTAILYLVVLVITYLVMSVSMMVFFRKTGVEPWKAWVPVYSYYEWLRLGGQNGNWVWFILVPGASIITTIFLFIGMHATGKAFRLDTGFLVLGIFLPVVWLLMLGLGSRPYEPQLIAEAGLRPPLTGFGAVPGA